MSLQLLQGAGTSQQLLRVVEATAGQRQVSAGCSQLLLQQRAIRNGKQGMRKALMQHYYARGTEIGRGLLCLGSTSTV